MKKFSEMGIERATKKLERLKKENELLFITKTEREEIEEYFNKNA